MEEDRVFSQDYCEELPLPEGSVMRLRLARPEDRAGILEAFERLSTETRVQRWFYPKMRLTDAELDALVSPGDTDHAAIIATEVDKEGVERSGIGMGRFVRSSDDPAAAEIAITVVDDWQGLGIGRILLHRLLAMMSERRIPFAVGRLQAENQRMRHLLEPYVPKGGFEREDAVLLFRFPIPAPGDPLMAQLARNAAAVARMLKRMAEGGIVLPLALVEKRLQSLGPRAVLAELRKREQRRED